jgi:hypothetical protein
MPKRHSTNELFVGFRMNINGTFCKLCKKGDDLQVSHVLPRFLGKYLKETSATGFLTAVDVDGKPSRTQDIYKRQLLCGQCESVLNEAETFFADKVFYPFKKSKLKSIPVDDRLGRFAVSVSLRALWIMQLVEHPLVERWKDQLRGLESEWRNYLLKTPNFVKGGHSHHILLCNETILAFGLKNSPNLIHNVLRTSAYYLFEKFEKAYVFANLAGVQVISMISPPELPVSRGTEVYPNQTFGVVGPPGIGWGGYFQNLLELARKCDGARSRLSVSQKEMIERAIDKDPERAAMSEDGRIHRMQQELLRSILNEDR